jgi:septum formation topological specificity factor MinE
MKACSSNERWVPTSNMLLKMRKELLFYIRQHAPISMEELGTNTRETSVRTADVPF